MSLLHEQNLSFFINGFVAYATLRPHAEKTMITITGDIIESIIESYLNAFTVCKSLKDYSVMQVNVHDIKRLFGKHEPAGCYMINPQENLNSLDKKHVFMS
ncbi:CLUMA_CG008948, isoform A [Clunio marinus]|uniref:CLUMA_CG008948, isoform A n=1 Tax=Clunio marinus TaxID=568069 RepID=A0A1J1I565_9DIPT|nr:CLUMA_CG008948, isoform A [Clunio marinus]